MHEGSKSLLVGVFVGKLDLRIRARAVNCDVHGLRNLPKLDEQAQERTEEDHEARIVVHEVQQDDQLCTPPKNCQTCLLREPNLTAQSIAEVLVRNPDAPGYSKSPSTQLYKTATVGNDPFSTAVLWLRFPNHVYY
jgi:hypothetical protein